MSDALDTGILILLLSLSDSFIMMQALKAKKAAIGAAKSAPKLLGGAAGKKGIKKVSAK